MSIAASFTAESFVTVTAAVIKAGNAVDKASANAASHVATWAIAAAVGINAKALTLDNVRDGLIKATPAKVRAANVAGTNTSAETIGACGNTVKGWFYAFQRIANTEGGLARLIAGEAFNTLARAAKPVQQQKAKGNAKSGSTPKGETDNTAAAILATEVATSAPITVESLAEPLIAMLNGMSVKALKANEGQIALLIAAIGKANAKLAAANKAPRAKKAAPAPVALAA